MESGAMADANTEGDSAMGGAITRARCKYTRGDVRGKWLELRQRLQASGVDAPLPLEPAAAPAAAALPSSEAQQLALREQLADMKAMFEQGLIPSRKIYEDKVRQILGLE